MSDENQDTQKAPERVRYIVRNAAYALQPQPPVKKVINGLINRGDLVIAFGEPGSKKTYIFAGSVAVCVAGGKPCMGFNTTQTKVLIVDEESGERRMSARLGAAIRGELCDETLPLEYVCQAGFNLDDPNDVTLLQFLIEESGAGLVVIDALADVMTGDENLKKDVQPVFNRLRKIANATNAAIIVIHHSNKTGGYRGSSAIKGAIDLMIEVKSDEEKPFINFKTTKTRDIERVSWAAEAVWTDDQFYLRAIESTDSPVLSKGESYVIRFLTERLSASMEDIESHADTCSPNTARQAVYSLTSKGYTKRIDGGGRGHPSVYALVEGRL